jgi:hypothetical protein
VEIIGRVLTPRAIAVKGRYPGPAARSGAAEEALVITSRLRSLLPVLPAMALLPALAGCAGQFDQAAEDCVSAINADRATLKLAPYTRWSAEESCAGGQAETDSESGVPHSAFGTCGEHAQDECPGWPGPPDTMITQCLAQMWAEGPGTDFSTHGHFINMSSTAYTMVACGFYVESDGSVWATQDFM